MSILSPLSAASSGVMVVGMHRSGTSLATHLVVKSGFVAGGELMQATKGNPRGFWEHLGVVETHDKFLERLGRDWSDTTPLPDDAFRGEAAAWACEELRGHLERDLLPLSRWVLKDPRLCRLLPLWKPVLDREDLGVRHLVVVRSPHAVAESLRSRDGFPLHHGLLLWLVHYLEMERATRSAPRHWFDFDRFSRSPLEVFDELAAWLGSAEEGPATSAQALLDSVYRPDLVHHLRGSADDPAAPPWIAETHAALESLAPPGAESPDALEALDRVGAELERTRMFLYRSHERTRLETELNEARSGCDKIRAERNEAQWKRDRIREQRNDAQWKRDRIREQRNDAQAERDGFRNERDEARREYDRVRTEAGHLRRKQQATLRELEVAKRHYQQLEATLQEIFASRSWRWTKPLRRDRNR